MEITSIFFLCICIKTVVSMCFILFRLVLKQTIMYEYEEPIEDNFVNTLRIHKNTASINSWTYRCWNKKN